MSAQLTLPHFLDRAVSLYGDKKAIFDKERVFTYNNMNERVNQLSRGLRDLGINKGDSVAYLASNNIEMLEGFYGVFQIGAVMVPLNIRLIPEDYLYILNHSESKVLMVDQSYYHLIEPIKESLETIEHIIVLNKDDNTNEIDYDKWLDLLSNSPIERPHIDENDVCSLLYTSGTTGAPKGVMLTHRNNYLHALTTMHHLRVSDTDVYLHVLPMFHVNGWGAPFYYTGNGATHICLERVDPEEIFKAIAKHNVSVIHMAPTVLNSLLQYYQENTLDVHQNLRVVIAGSAPPAAFVKKVESELGWEFIQVYGMTETAPLNLISGIRSEVTSHLTENEQMELKAKTGYSMIGSSVKIVNDLGNEVSWDGLEVGELIVNGHGVMKGYWKNEEATRKAIKNNWIYTGDMGTVDEYGYIQIVDRKKDIIISGGENISSIEIESVLYEHPLILEAAVIAVPNEKWGETPHAYVVLKENSDLTEGSIIEYTREKVAHFKAVTSVTFVEELPKTGSGKIQKVPLREAYLKKYNFSS